MPVAAVADTVATSAALLRTSASTDDEPENVLVAVKVWAVDRLATSDKVLLPKAIVLFVRVSEPARVDRVPVVGNVTFVAAVRVRVYAKLPEPVTVIAALFATPVPPLAAGKVPVTFDAKLTKVVEVDPVPPEATGNAEPRVKEVK